MIQIQKIKRLTQQVPIESSSASIAICRERDISVMSMWRHLTDRQAMQSSPINFNSPHALNRSTKWSIICGLI